MVSTLEPLEPVFERSHSQEIRDTQDPASSTDTNVQSPTAGDNDTLPGDEAPSGDSNVIDAPHRDLNGWEITLLWAGCVGNAHLLVYRGIFDVEADVELSRRRCILAWYMFLQMIVLPAFMDENPVARNLLFNQVRGENCGLHGQRQHGCKDIMHACMHY